MTAEKRLVRSKKDQMIAGVAGGLAEYFDIDVVLVRVAFVALALLGGPGVLLYIILWIVMPEGEAAPIEAPASGPEADKAPETEG